MLKHITAVTRDKICALGYKKELRLVQSEQTLAENEIHSLQQN